MLARLMSFLGVHALVEGAEKLLGAMGKFGEVHSKLPDSVKQLPVKFSGFGTNDEANVATSLGLLYVKLKGDSGAAVDLGVFNALSKLTNALDPHQRRRFVEIIGKMPDREIKTPEPQGKDDKGNPKPDKITVRLESSAIPFLELLAKIVQTDGVEAGKDFLLGIRLILEKSFGTRAWDAFQKHILTETNKRYADTAYHVVAGELKKSWAKDPATAKNGVLDDVHDFVKERNERPLWKRVLWR